MGHLGPSPIQGVPSQVGRARPAPLASSIRATASVTAVDKRQLRNQPARARGAVQPVDVELGACGAANGHSHANGHRSIAHVLSGSNIQLSDAEPQLIVLDEASAALSNGAQANGVLSHSLQGSQVAVLLPESASDYPASPDWGIDELQSADVALEAPVTDASGVRHASTSDHGYSFLDAASRSNSEASTSQPSHPGPSRARRRGRQRPDNGAAGAPSPQPAGQSANGVNAPGTGSNATDGGAQTRRQQQQQQQTLARDGHRHKQSPTTSTRPQGSPTSAKIASSIGGKSPRPSSSGTSMPATKDATDTPQSRSLTVAIQRCLYWHEVARLVQPHFQLRDRKQYAQGAGGAPVPLNPKQIAAALHRLALLTSNDQLPRQQQRMLYAVVCELLTCARSWYVSSYMQSRELATIMWSLSRLRFEAGRRTKPLFIELMTACYRRFDSFSAQGLAMVLHCVADSGMDSLRKDWAKAYFGAVTREAGSLTPHGMAMILRACAVLRSPPPPVLQRKLVSQMLSAMQLQQQAQKRSAPSGHSSAVPPTPAPATSSRTSSSKDAAPDLLPSDVTLFLWSLAKLRVKPLPGWLAAVESWSRPRLSVMDEQELSNLVWSMARLQHTPSRTWSEALYDTLQGEGRLQHLRPQALSNILYSLAQLKPQPGHVPPPPELVQAFLDAAAADGFRGFTHQGLALLVSGAAQLQHPPGKAWLDALHRQLSSHQGELDARVPDMVREAFRQLGYNPAPRGGQGSPVSAFSYAPAPTSGSGTYSPRPSGTSTSSGGSSSSSSSNGSRGHLAVASIPEQQQQKQHPASDISPASPAARLRQQQGKPPPPYMGLAQEQEQGASAVRRVELHLPTTQQQQQPGVTHARQPQQAAAQGQGQRGQLHQQQQLPSPRQQLHQRQQQGRAGFGSMSGSDDDDDDDLVVADLARLLNSSSSVQGDDEAAVLRSGGSLDADDVYWEQAWAGGGTVASSPDRASVSDDHLVVLVKPSRFLP